METPVKFDPETGLPVNNQINNEKVNNNKSLIIGMTVFIVITLIFLAVILFLILKKENAQIPLAISNTISEIKEKNSLYKTLDVEDIVSDNEYTIYADVDTEIPRLGDISIESDIAVADEKISLKGNVDLSYIPPVEYTVNMDDKEVSMNLPLLQDYTFVYDYTKNNDGYLMSRFDIKSINSVMSQIYDIACKSDFKANVSDELYKVLSDEFEEKKFSRAKSASYIINDKETKCKGYKTTLSNDEIHSIFMRTREIVCSNYQGLLDISGIDLEALLDTSKDYGDVELTVYVDQNMLAAIIIDEPARNTSTQIVFSGGDYRAQNVVVAQNDNTLFTLSGATVDQGEIATFSNLLTGQQYSYAYDMAREYLTVTYLDGYSSTQMNMDITRDKKQLSIDLDYVDLGDTYIGGSFRLEDKAEIVNIGSNKIFDLGQASEVDVEGLISDVYGIVLGLMGW